MTSAVVFSTYISLLVKNKLKNSRTIKRFHSYQFTMLLVTVKQVTVQQFSESDMYWKTVMIAGTWAVFGTFFSLVLLYSLKNCCYDINMVAYIAPKFSVQWKCCTVCTQQTRENLYMHNIKLSPRIALVTTYCGEF